METTMTDTDKVIQVAASRIQGLTRQVNHWKDRTEELEAALGIEKAALTDSDGLFARLRQSIAHRDFAEIALAEAHEAIWGLGCEMTNLRCDLATARDECNRALGKFVDVKVSQVFDCTKDFLRAEIADLRMTFDAVHYALGIKSGDNIIKAIDKLKQERDCAKDEWDREEERCKGLASDIEVLRVELRESQKEAVTARQDAVTRAEADRKRIDGLMIQAQDMRAEIERLKKPRQHPVKVGESVRRTTEGSIAPIGTLGRVLVVGSDAYQVELRKGFSTMWAFDDCTPCDPPPEATHDTPEGQEMAQAAVTPQPEDKVRLVRVPTKQDCKEYDYTDPEQRRLVERRLHTTGTVLAGKHECGCLKVQMAHSAFVKAWPQSCIEIVDAK